MSSPSTVKQERLSTLLMPVIALLCCFSVIFEVILMGVRNAVTTREREAVLTIVGVRGLEPVPSYV